MRWYSLLAMTLLAGFLIRSFEPARADDKKEPAKTDKKDDKKEDKKEPATTDKKDDKGPYLLIVPPTGGKEVKLADWRFTQGTRRLALTGEPVNPKTKTAGTEYLEFREEKSTTYKNGIFTFLPLSSVRKLDYDREKKSVSVVTLMDDGKEATLVGSTKFVSNKITLEAEAILDGLGSATVTFHGGIDKGLQSITFPAPKAAEKVKGLPAIITADDKEKTKHSVFDVQPVYLVDGQYRIMPFVMFKKTVKVDMDKLAGLRFIPSQDKKKISTEYEVTLRDGAKHSLNLLTLVEVEKKKSITFVGLISRVPVGYKLFMTDAILEYQAVEEKKE